MQPDGAAALVASRIQGLIDMADDAGTARPPKGRPRSYLPVLTWTLLVLMGTYSLVWHFFYRPSPQLRAFQEALRYIPANFIREVDRQKLFEAAMVGMMASLEDKYSGYVTPEENQRIFEQTRGEYVGVGVTITRADGLPVVVDVLPDSPALEVGIEQGDLITHVEDESVRDWPLEDVVRAIRGDAGTQVKLRLLRPATETSSEVTVARRKLSLPNVEWKMREDGIGVVSMNAFDDNCARELRQGLEELTEQGLKGLVLDLRNNAGGLVREAVAACDLFISDGLLVAIRGRPGTTVERVEAHSTTALDEAVPVVVLVNEATASAAEILSGSLQANGRATVVGAKTVGKGSVTNVHPLNDDSGLVLTVAQYELTGGKKVEGEGIQPDVVVGEFPAFPQGATAEEVTAWRTQLRAARQAQLDAAVELLTGESEKP